MNIEGSSLRKGETLSDTAHTIGAMSPDLVVIRHSEDNSAEEISKLLECPVVNAGEGINEHPTQALLDAFTILDHKKTLKISLFQYVVTLNIVVLQDQIIIY